MRMTHLQGGAYCDDFVSLTGIDLKQHRHGFFLHGSSNVTKSAAGFTQRNIGNLTVTCRNCARDIYISNGLVISILLLYL